MAPLQGATRVGIVFMPQGCPTLGWTCASPLATQNHEYFSLAAGDFEAGAAPAATLLAAGTDLGCGKARAIALGRLNGLNELRFMGVPGEGYPQVTGLVTNRVDLELFHGTSLWVAGQ